MPVICFHRRLSSSSLGTAKTPPEHVYLTPSEQCRNWFATRNWVETRLDPVDPQQIIDRLVDMNHAETWWAHAFTGIRARCAKRHTRFPPGRFRCSSGRLTFVRASNAQTCGLVPGSLAARNRIRRYPIIHVPQSDCDACKTLPKLPLRRLNDERAIFVLR